MKLTVVCFKWNGWRNVYSAEHVNVLARMLHEHLHMPFEMVCLTDDYHGITECEVYPIWELPVVQQAKPQNSYVRLHLFDPTLTAFLEGHILQIDLDCVILNDLTPLITDVDFRAVRGVGAPLNGSMYLLRVGAHPHVWTEFDIVESPKLIAETTWNHKKICGSDQAWMSLKIPGAKTWGPEDGVYQYLRLPEKMVEPRIVFFAGETKPWSEKCRLQRPELHEAYRRFR